MNKTITISTLALALGLSGCANMSETQKGTAKGAGIGAAAGAVVGAVAGGGKGAAIGAVVGAGAGAIAAGPLAIVCVFAAAAGERGGQTIARPPLIQLGASLKCWTDAEMLD